MDAASASRTRSATSERPARSAGRRRRPSGEPPPLPRKLGLSGGVWIVLAVTLVAVSLLALGLQSLGNGFERWDSAVLRTVVAPLRSSWLTHLALGINASLGSRWAIRIQRRDPA